MPASRTASMTRSRSASAYCASAQQCPAKMRPLKRWRRAAAAMRSSERASREQLSSTWKSRSSPCASAAPKMRSSASSSFGSGGWPRKVTAPSTPPCFAAVVTMERNCGSSSAAISVVNSGTACSAMRSFHCSRSSAKTGQEIAVCLPMESRCVRIAPVPCAKAQRSAKSMRARTSSALQCASRSLATVSRAAKKVPSGFGARARNVALVEMGMHVDEARQRHAAVEIDGRQVLEPRGQGAEGRDAAVLHDDVAGREAIDMRRLGKVRR